MNFGIVHASPSLLFRAPFLNLTVQLYFRCSHYFILLYIMLIANFTKYLFYQVLHGYDTYYFPFF